MTPRLTGALLAALFLGACTGDPGTPDLPDADDIETDGGADAGDAGPVDGGDPDAGDADGGSDAGTPVELKVRTVSPPRGQLAGGTMVVLQGQGFVDGFALVGGREASDKTQISFGGNSAIDVNVIDDDTLEVRTPAGLRGNADIVVTNPNGSFTCEKCFTYYETVELARIAPAMGSVQGGDPVTLTGKGFVTGVLVLVGGSEATDVVVAEDGLSLTARTPPGVAGSADVAVVGANSAAFLRRGFVFVSPVRVSRVAPASAPIGESAEATVHGSGFTADAQVLVGGVAATSVTFVSESELQVELPAGTAPGAGDVKVTQRRGEATLAGAFAWTDPSERDVQLFLVSPRSGPSAGGTCAFGAATCLTLVGAGLADPELTVKVGESVATFRVLDANTLAVDLPAGAPGVVDVQVRGARGAAILPDSFGYLPELTLSRIDPAKGPASGAPATTATITGTGLASDCTFRIGANAAASVIVNSAGSEATLTVPPGSPGKRDVRVTCGAPDSLLLRGAVLPGAFTYTAPLELRTLDPDYGSIAGGTLVTLYGNGFADGMEVLFGRERAASVEVKGPHLAYVRTPKGAVGAVDVKAATGFLSDDALRAGYSYIDTTNTLGGGSGGAMRGTLNVTVWNSTQGMSGPVDGATVSINNDQLVGITDARGQVTFSDPVLLKPVSITSKKAAFAAATIARIDARNVTIMMQMNEGGEGNPSFPPPPPPAVFRGRVCGFKLPAGRTLGPTESVEARVYFTAPYVYAAPPFGQLSPPAVVISDCEAPWQLSTRRFGPMAIYAEWGIVDSATSPASFTPLLMGIRRGLEAAPDRKVENLDIVLDMHRDVDFPVKVEPAAPPPGAMVVNLVFSYLDLGGEGVVPLAQTQSLLNDFLFEDHPRVSGEGLMFLNFAGLLDDTTGDIAPPYSFYYRRQYGDLAGGVHIGPMLAFTQLTTPGMLGTFTGGLAWDFTEGQRPDVQQVFVEQPQMLASKPIWDIVLPGSEEGVTMPSSVLQTLERGAMMQWTVITSRAPRFDYDRFTYQQLGLTSWTAFTQDGSIFLVP